jgi:hypothetical protein
MQWDPVLLDSINEPGKLLTRTEVEAKGEKSERWLQELVFRRPELLPVSFFDEDFSPLIPLGMEIGVPAGSIDNLYVSPTGRITIVETKLWKNPEKHRTVLAQIINYARDLAQWDYDQLNEAVIKASRQKGADGKSLEEIAKPYLETRGLSLVEFQERLIRNLEAGEFLLLVVGDRISPNVAMLGDVIKGSPGLNFTLGFVEIQLYRLNADSEWPILIVPDVVGRTVEKTRFVVKILYDEKKPSTVVELVNEDERQETERKGLTTPDIFLMKISEDIRPVFERWWKEWGSRKMVTQWGTAGFSVRIPIKSSYKTFLRGFPDDISLLLRKTDADELGVSAERYEKYLDEIKQVSQAYNILAQGKNTIVYDAITSEELDYLIQATTQVAIEAMDK